MAKDTGRTTKNPSEYNQPQKYGGCTDVAACDRCGCIVSDEICMCIGAFTCPRCGYEQPPRLFGPGYVIETGKIE
jgi:hypothetical protein